MAARDDGLQGPYMVTLNMTTLEHLKLYNMASVEFPESDRYDLIRFKWKVFTNNLRILYPHLNSK